MKKSFHISMFLTMLIAFLAFIVNFILVINDINPYDICRILGTFFAWSFIICLSIYIYIVSKNEKLLKYNKHKNSKFRIEDLDLMSGAEFENFITYLFNQLGYKASNTKLSGDQGIDVIAEKGNTILAIQCKCFHSSVGNHAIMEAFTGAKYYNADKCMVITNSFFTKSAKELAYKTGVILWDRQILKEKLEEI